MSAFQSTWGNSQQTQQQQQPNAFGQPSGFGTSGEKSRDKPSNTMLNLHVAFGGTSAFGGQNQQQQQQPAANPMFGNLGGTPNTNTGTTGFGAFSL
jgi:nuclear pore complex protein Nup98-Nup96